MSAQERRGSSVPVFTVDQICHIQDFVGAEHKGKTVVALVYVHASWTTFPSLEHPLNHSVLKSLLQADSSEMINVVGSISLDQSDDAMACAVGDDDYSMRNDDQDHDLPIPPAQLPALALSVQVPSQGHAKVCYITDISPFELQRFIRHHNNPQSARVRSAWSKLIHTALIGVLSPDDNTSADLDNNKRGKKRSHQAAAATNSSNSNEDEDEDEEAIRIFIAGDRSSVGKSSVCLGLLGNLVSSKFGYAPSQLAYIKPATQCEAPQLVQAYCESVGIDCRAVGPLVYYKGFTRAFLAGETGQTTNDLLRDCGRAVDTIAQSKKIVLVDGVGFPAVGSICGTDNASVSKACGYPVATNTTTGTTDSAAAASSSSSTGAARHPMGVVLVGGSGVGAAVDSFNLNATYFETANVPVMGGIFNKLSTEGYYSLENCRTQLTSYFDQNEHQKRLGRVPFGFVPLFDGLAGDNALQQVDDFIKVFGDHVNVQAIVDSAKSIKRKAPSPTTTTTTTTADDNTADHMEIDSPSTPSGSDSPANKRLKPNSSSRSSSRKVERRSGSNGIKRGLSRKDIEDLAAQQGAATA